MSDVNRFVKGVVGRLTGQGADVDASIQAYQDAMAHSLHTIKQKWADSNSDIDPVFVWVTQPAMKQPQTVKDWFTTFQYAPIDGLCSNDDIRAASIAVLRDGEISCKAWAKLLWFFVRSAVIDYNDELREAIRSIPKHRIEEVILNSNSLKQYSYILSSDVVKGEHNE